MSAAKARPVLGVVGLGLIGGSITQGWLGHGDVVAWTRNPDTREAAAEAGVAVVGSPAEVVDAADIVVLATPLPVLADTLETVAAAVNARRDPPTVTDVGSVKSAIAARAAVVLDDPSVFVPGHPMAGTQHTGWGAADPGLFVAARWALGIDEPVDLDRWATVASVACRLGAEVVPVEVADHDRAVALVSHLPYALAACLSSVVGEDPLASALAAGSFASATRVVSTADGARLGSDLAMANGPALVRALDRMAGLIDEAREAVDSGDAARVAEVFVREPSAERTALAIDWPTSRGTLVDLGRQGGAVVAVGPHRLGATVPGPVAS